MAVQDHTTAPPPDPFMRAYEELGLSCGDVKGWSRVLLHLSLSPHAVEADEMRVISDAVLLLSHRLNDEREWLLRQTGRMPPVSAQ